MVCCTFLLAMCCNLCEMIYTESQLTIYLSWHVKTEDNRFSALKVYLYQLYTVFDVLYVHNNIHKFLYRYGSTTNCNVGCNKYAIAEKFYSDCKIFWHPKTAKFFYLIKICEIQRNFGIVVSVLARNLRFVHLTKYSIFCKLTTYKNNVVFYLRVLHSRKAENTLVQNNVFQPEARGLNDLLTGSTCSGYW